MNQVTTAGVLAALSFLCAATVYQAEAGDRPNILFIYADDIGYEALNSYGGLDFETPRWNQMAKDGLQFDRAYAPFARRPASACIRVCT